MKFMMMIKATRDYEAGVPPSPALMAGMARLTEASAKAGTLLASGGLEPSARGTRIRYSGGRRTVTDGPFTETKEVVGGYAVIEAPSRKEALEQAERVLEVHLDAGVADFEIEIRPLFHHVVFSPAR